MNEEIKGVAKQSHYDEWIEQNASSLYQDFARNNLEEFQTFCKEMYKNFWGESR